MLLTPIHIYLTAKYSSLMSFLQVLVRKFVSNYKNYLNSYMIRMKKSSRTYLTKGHISLRIRVSILDNGRMDRGMEEENRYG